MFVCSKFCIFLFFWNTAGQKKLNLGININLSLPLQRQWVWNFQRLKGDKLATDKLGEKSKCEMQVKCENT